jgi:PEP-CTERM motif
MSLFSMARHPLYSVRKFELVGASEVKTALFTTLVVQLSRAFFSFRLFQRCIEHVLVVDSGKSLYRRVYQLKLRNVVLAALLGAGSLHASILQGQASGLATFSWDQTFASPALTPQSPLVNPATQFANLSLLDNTASTSLYYDPNGSSSLGCNMGNTLISPGSLAGMTACVGNYTLSSVTGSTQSSPSGVQPTSTSFSILYDTPVIATSFVLATPAASGTVTQTLIQVYNLANVLIDSLAIHTSIHSAGEYVVINESQAIGSVTISSTGANEALNASWNAVLSNVEATNAPEPGTLGLLGLGLAGVGYFARRRKSA